MRKGKASAGLDLVRDYVNTLDVETGSDAVEDPASLREWLAGRGLLVGDLAVDERELELAIELREALRSLLLANNGGVIDPDSVETFNRLASGLRLVVHFHRDGGAGLEPESAGVDGALGRILAVVVGAMAEGTWSRLKACRNQDCEWAFYDHSRNRSGKWCTMDVCGNRMKARAYRRRDRADENAQ